MLAMKRSLPYGYFIETALGGGVWTGGTTPVADNCVNVHVIHAGIILKM